MQISTGAHPFYAFCVVMTNHSKEV